MRVRVALGLQLALTLLVVGCGGSSGCPSMSPDAQSLAAQATAIQFDIYDANDPAAVCDGNDIAAGAPAPLVTRRVDGNAGTQLMLPSGHYIVVLHAFDAAGAFIGSACEAEVFSPGQQACLSIGLTQPMYDGDGGVIISGSDGGGGNGGAGGDGDMAMTGGFVPQSSGVTSTLYQPWSPGGGVVYVAGAAGVILKSTDYGATWNKLTTGTTNDIEAIWGSSATDVYAVGYAATVLHTTNGGASWSKVTVPVASNPAFYDVWGTGPNDVYISGDFGYLVHGSGTSWNKTNIGGGNGPALNCVWGASPSEVYLFNVKGGILKGSGTSFSNVATPTSDTLMYGWGSGDGSDIWIPSVNDTMTSSTLWHSTDHGATFKAQLTLSTPIWALWSTPAGHAYIVGAALLQESTDHGATWTTAGTTQATLYGVGGDPSGSDVWAAGINGIILHRGP